MKVRFVHNTILALDLYVGALEKLVDEGLSVQNVRTSRTVWDAIEHQGQARYGRSWRDVSRQAGKAGAKPKFDPMMSHLLTFEFANGRGDIWLRDQELVTA